MEPSTTLFVVGFDPTSIRQRDLDEVFDPFGKVVRVCGLFINL
jgi:hypothetical protein